MEIINRATKQIRLPEQLKTSSILPAAHAKYPAWLDELFLRFAVIYDGRWTYSIQDPRMLELKKAEWFETLQDFDAEIIKETVTDVKKMPGEFPSLHKFYEVATSKAKFKKARKEMEEREREKNSGKLLDHKVDSEAAREAREAIRKLCKIKTVK